MPLAVWACGLVDGDDVLRAVIADVQMIHPNQLVIEAVFIYVMSITHLLKNPRDPNRALASFSIAKKLASTSQTFSDPVTHQTCLEWLELA